MTDSAPAADAPSGACVQTRERRLRYAWLAALAAGILVLTAALSLGDQPYAAEHRVFGALNGLPGRARASS